MEPELRKARPTDRMERFAVNLLIEWGCGPDSKPEKRRQVLAEIEAVAADLAGPSPSPTERLLADAAAHDWFALKLFEARYASALVLGRELTLAEAEHTMRRIDRTHRRLMSTLKTLATIRRLALPSLQVNIARNQQVNNMVDT